MPVKAREANGRIISSERTKYLSMVRKLLGLTRISLRQFKRLSYCILIFILRRIKKLWSNKSLRNLTNTLFSWEVSPDLDSTVFLTSLRSYINPRSSEMQHSPLKSNRARLSGVITQTDTQRISKRLKQLSVSLKLAANNSMLTWWISCARWPPKDLEKE